MSHYTSFHEAEQVFPAQSSKTTSVIQSRTQALVGLLLVNSHQAKRSLCSLSMMSKDSFMWQNWKLLILLVIVLRRWFYATPPAVTLGSPSHRILQLNAQQNLNSNHATTCSIPVNPFSATTKITPSFVTTVIDPTYGHTALMPLCWGGPPHPTLPAPAPKNAILIKAFADAISSKRNDPLPKWKLFQYNGDLLQWHEWYGQFKSAIDSQSLTDDAKLIYLKNLVTGKAKTKIDEFAYSGAVYKDALKTIKCKLGQPQAPVNAHLDKLSILSSLKMQNIDNIINYSGCISIIVGVIKTPSYGWDLKSASLLNTAVKKLRPNMSESWSLFTVRTHWKKTTLLDFNDWFKEKAEALDLLKDTASKEYRYHQPSNQRHLLQLYNKRVFQKPQQSAFSTSIPRCILC